MHSRIITIFLLLCLCATQSAAQTISIGRLSDRQGGMLRYRIAENGRIDALLRRFIPYFKVPAQAGSRVRCDFNYGPLTCMLEMGPRQCPTEVEVEVRGSNQRARARVNCLGPDAEGNCECEFAGG